MFAKIPTPAGHVGPDLIAEDLGMAPYLLAEVQNDMETKRQIIKDLAYMGYKGEKAFKAILVYVGFTIVSLIAQGSEAIFIFAIFGEVSASKGDCSIFALDAIMVPLACRLASPFTWE